MSFPESSVIIAKTKPKTVPKLCDNFILSCVKQEPRTNDNQSWVLHSDEHNYCERLSYNPFLCKYCGKHCKGAEALENHTRTHEPKIAHPCGICLKTFSTKRLVMKHEYKHTGEKRCKCEICGKAFVLNTHLKTHNTLMHSGSNYQCIHCGTYFSTHLSLEKHVRTHAEELPFTCHKCDRRFKKLSCLRFHLRNHTVGRKCKCESCEEAFQPISDLGVQRRMDHVKDSSDSFFVNPSSEPNIDPEPCDDFILSNVKQEPWTDDDEPGAAEERNCNQTPVENSTLENHHLLEVKEEPCDLEIFDEPEFKYDLTNPIIPVCEESAPSLFECDQCHRVFRTKEDIIQHVNFHLNTLSLRLASKNPLASFPKTRKTGVKTSKQKSGTANRAFVCEYCDAVFTRSCFLSMHRRSHFPKEPHQCEICLTLFNYRSVLLAHKRTHTGEKPYKCEICERAFANKGALNLHNNNKHSALINQCELCGKKYSYRPDLKNHMLTHTGEKPFACKICGKRYVLKKHLNSHERSSHAREKRTKCEICEICEMTFVSRRSLKHHIDSTHRGIKYQCELCGKDFSRKQGLKNHLSTHTGGKPFVCQICDKRFRLKEQCTSHERIHFVLGKYQCAYCEKTFKYLTDQYMHSYADHGEAFSKSVLVKRNGDSIACPEPCDDFMGRGKEESCDLEVFEEPEFKCDLTNPINPHCEKSGPSLFECDQCHRHFKTKDKIAKHVKNHLKTGSSGPGSKKRQVSLPKTFKTSAIPQSSRGIYLKSYDDFKKWTALNNEGRLSEDVFQAYFLHLSTKLKLSCVWSRYSMLRCTMNIYDNVDISQFENLLPFLRKEFPRYRKKIYKVLHTEHVKKFIEEASDEHHLLSKVILIFGFSGALKKHEVHQITVNNVVDNAGVLTVKIRDKEAHRKKSFNITGWMVPFYKKYVALRPVKPNTNKLFLAYDRGKCTTQILGIRRIHAIPREVAFYLGLEKSELYRWSK